MESKEPQQLGQPVLVTTEQHVVFFGYAAGDLDGEQIRLERGRLVVYWSPDMRGFMGLATSGPSDACRIGPAANITIRHITSVTEVAAEAVARFEAAPWAGNEYE